MKRLIMKQFIGIIAITALVSGCGGVPGTKARAGGKEERFAATSHGVALGYNFENLSTLKERYDLERVAGSGDDFSRALNTLFWLCKHVRHDGNFDNHVPMDAIDLLAYSFDQGEEHGLNCLNLSEVLTECLLSLGIYARRVGLYPASPLTAQNHVVTHVWIPGAGKWVMMDPEFDCYLKDASGSPLDLFEIREALNNSTDIYLNAEFSRNGESASSSEENLSLYKDFLGKDLYWFITSEISAAGPDRDKWGKTLYICPAGFDPLKWNIEDNEYRLKLLRADKGLDKKLRAELIATYTAKLEAAKTAAAAKSVLFLSKEDFLAPPY